MTVIDRVFALRSEARTFVWRAAPGLGDYGTSRMSVKPGSQPRGQSPPSRSPPSPEELADHRAVLHALAEGAPPSGRMFDSAAGYGGGASEELSGQWAEEDGFRDGIFWATKGNDYAVDNRAAEEEILPLAMDQGIAVMVYLPFGRSRMWQRIGDRAWTRCRSPEAGHLRLPWRSGRSPERAVGGR